MFTKHPSLLAISALLLIVVGSLREGHAAPPWGDGSAGDLVVAASGTLGVTIAADGNFQFRDFTVLAGVILQVPSGTVIRCRSQFENQGTIVVLPGERGGVTSAGVAVPPGYGVSHRPAGAGSVGDANVSTQGGQPGQGLSSAEARTLRYVGPGAGGGGGSSGIFGAGGSGGGSLTVLARKGITNDGTILAPPTFLPGLMSPGDGGGGGGVIILGSRRFISNMGTILAQGGGGENGGPTLTFVAGGGGGGGGGIIHFLSPDIEVGKVNVDGGAGGQPPLPSGSFQRAGGGAGGACGGNGGGGGAVSPGTSMSFAGQDGQEGYVIETKVDPTWLF